MQRCNRNHFIISCPTDLYQNAPMLVLLLLQNIPLVWSPSVRRGPLWQHCVTISDLPLLAAVDHWHGEHAETMPSALWHSQNQQAVLMALG